MMSIAPSLLSLLLAAASHPDTDTLTLMGEIALERGDCKVAAESYSAALPQSDAALARRASEVALACEHLPAAWAAVQRWRSLDPGDANAAAIYATVALKLFRVDDASAALRLLAQGDDVRLAGLVSVLGEETDAPAVLAALGRAVDVKNASPAALNLLAQVAFDGYDLGRAQQYAELALKADPKSFEARHVMARVYAARGDELNAVANAEAAQADDRERGMFEKAQILSTLDRTAQAREALEQARAAGAPANEVERQLGQLAFDAGDLAEATRHFTALIQRSGPAKKDNSDTATLDTAWLYLAQISERQKDKDAALAGFERLANSSLAATARSRAASLLLERGQRAEALKILDDFVTEHPERSFETTLTKAQLLADHGEVESGLTLIEAALERHPQHPTLEYQRAVLLERAGCVRESVTGMEQLLARRPQDPSLLNALGYTLADHGMRLAQAEILIRRALAVMPDNPAAIDSLGWVRLKRGSVKGAVPILQRAYLLARDAQIAAHLGEALWKSGDRKEARKIWQAALEREPDSKELEAVIEHFAPAGKS